MDGKFQNKLKKSFQNKDGISQDNSPNWVLDNLPDKGSHYYGIEKGNRFVKRMKLMFRNGNTVSIPYSFLPVIIHNPSRDLKIKTTELKITITGRGLGKVEGWLNEEKVTWIRESNTGTDDGKGDVFISNIIIEGALIN